MSYCEIHKRVETTPGGGCPDCHWDWNRNPLTIDLRQRVKALGRERDARIETCAAHEREANARVEAAEKALAEERANVAQLEQRVCDFQAAGMIDVGGQGGPCRVEPKHIEQHVTELRAKVAALEAACEAKDGALVLARDRAWNAGFDYGACAADDLGKNRGLLDRDVIADRIDAALSPDAGRSLLAELEAARKVCEAACGLFGPYEKQTGLDPVNTALAAWRAAREGNK